MTSPVKQARYTCIIFGRKITLSSPLPIGLVAAADKIYDDSGRILKENNRETTYRIIQKLCSAHSTSLIKKIRALTRTLHDQETHRNKRRRL